MNTCKEDKPRISATEPEWSGHANAVTRCFSVILRLSALAFLGMFAVGAIAQPRISQRFTHFTGEPLRPGDIVFVDSGDAIQGGFVLKLDPDTGQESILASGGYLRNPFGVVTDPQGSIVVSDSGRLVRIEPTTGQQTLIPDNSHGILGYPYGFAFDAFGAVIAANGENIINFDPVSGRGKVLFSGHHEVLPLGVAFSEKGELFATAYPSQILRVNPKTGATTTVAEGGLLNFPTLMVVRNGAIYVTGVIEPNGNFGSGKVVRVDVATGETKLVSEGGFLVGPVGIALEADGHILVADPYTINPESPDLYDGGIIRINPTTGEQTLILRGYRNRVNPRGLMVVPGEPEPRKRVRDRQRAVPIFQK